MTDKPTEVVERAQLEVALELLEWNHGQALRRPWSDDAGAFYEAIKTLEVALDEGYETDPDRRTPLPDREITRSREAREAGYREATLLDERITTSHREPKGIIAALRRMFT